MRRNEYRDDPLEVVTVLFLVDRDVEQEDVERWTPEERKRAWRWAKLVMLEREDGYGAPLPLEPHCVRRDAKVLEELPRVQVVSIDAWDYLDDGTRRDIRRALGGVPFGKAA